MAVGELTQLVIFRTDLPVVRFTATWRPVAEGFLAAGLSTITLATFAGGSQDGVAFVSRNVWPEGDYRRAFPQGLAADGAAGAVSVTQAGVFSVHPGGGEPIATARPDRDLSMALLHLTHPAQSDAAIEAVLAATPADPSRHVVVYRGVHPAQRYHVAVTVHGPAGTGVNSTAALRAATAACPAVAHGVLLSGHELMTMAS